MASWELWNETAGWSFKSAPGISSADGANDESHRAGNGLTLRAKILWHTRARALATDFGSNHGAGHACCSGRGRHRGIRHRALHATKLQELARVHTVKQRDAHTLPESRRLDFIPRFRARGYPQADLRRRLGNPLSFTRRGGRARQLTAALPSGSDTLRAR